MRQMQIPRLYHELAYLWPQLSPPQDYAREAKAISDILAAKLSRSPAGRKPRILELGGGGGHTLCHLADRYDATNVDLSPAMLNQSRKLNPSITHEIGDMRQIRLGHTFDAVLAHDAIDYMGCPADLQAALATAAAHLHDNGVLIVAPTYLHETFINYQTEYDHYADEDVQLTYVSCVHRPGQKVDMFELAMLLLIRQNGQLRIVEDRHICGLFSNKTWLELLDTTGFDVDRSDAWNDATPWHAFVAVKRP